MNELEEAKEAIARIIYDNKWVNVWEKKDVFQLADQILKLPNIAVLAKDQSLPAIGCENMSGYCEGDGTCSDECWLEVAKIRRKYQQDMVKANFKRVIDE